MFVSQERAIVIPQSEHQRLAGALAQNWGNEDFSLPPISRTSFELGVATHDRAFGDLDTAAIGQISETDRVAQVDKWLNTAYVDQEAELVVLLHVRRLMNLPELKFLYKRVDERIQAIAAREGFDLAIFDQVDTVTDFCDLIAFDFSFESATQRTCTVYQNDDKTADITYKLHNGKIELDVWPFGVQSISGYILGYQRVGYPEELQPVTLNFEIFQG